MTYDSNLKYSVFVLLMDGIMVKINNSPFYWRHPRTTPGGPWTLLLKSGAGLIKKQVLQFFCRKYLITEIILCVISQTLTGERAFLASFNQPIKDKTVLSSYYF